MKKYMILLLTLMMLVGIGGMAYATTIAEPSSSGRVTGNLEINITMSPLATDLGGNKINCTVTFASGGVHNTSVTLATNKANTTGTDYVNFTIDTRTLKDTGSATISATCYNSTHSTTPTSITSFTIDNFLPTCSFSNVATGDTIKTGQSWTVAVTNTTTGKIVFGNNYYTGTVSTSNVFTYNAITGAPPEMSYDQVKFEATDGTNLTTCLISRVTIDDDLGGMSRSAKAQVLDRVVEAKAQKSGTQNKNINAILIIGGLGALAYLIFNKK